MIRLSPASSRRGQGVGIAQLREPQAHAGQAALELAIETAPED